MAERAGIGDSEKARDPRAVRAEVIRGFGGHVRVPAGPRGPGGLGRAGRAGAGPVADAGAGPGAVPAAALAGQPHRGRRPGARHPRPGEPGFHRGRARRENGRRYHLHPDVGGLAFLATVIDCHTKAVIGWATGDNYKTPLIQQAIEMAARNYSLAEGAVFHSDRGSNYTSCEFAKTLAVHTLRQSAGRTGICYDNAMAESFFAALKNERVYRTQYPTREHARRDVVRYIEFWYNSKRRHSGLQYRTPQQVHNEYLEQQSAA